MYPFFTNNIFKMKDMIIFLSEYEFNSEMINFVEFGFLKFSREYFP